MRSCGTSGTLSASRTWPRDRRLSTYSGGAIATGDGRACRPIRRKHQRPVGSYERTSAMNEVKAGSHCSAHRVWRGGGIPASI